MPGAGPILLFDKSVLQSLTVDESMWLDTFYFPCITPLFFIETLADLEKEVRKGRSPEDVVGNLAEKTPIGGGINAHHQTLSLSELMGQRVHLRHVPLVPGGNPVRAHDGRRAVVYDSPPETAALNRWQKHDFLEVERQFARAWRDALSGIDLEVLFRQGRDIIKRSGRPKDLPAAKQMAMDLLHKPGSRYVAEALAQQPRGLGQAILKRWRSSGSLPITEFAPYTAHLFLVDLFFCIGLGADLIGRERPTNKVDIAYLYYLPFCMVFTSRDKLHERTAPLFLDKKQVFVRGDDLKTDLAKLDEHYDSQLSDEEKLRGIMSSVHSPPLDGEFLVSNLWDKLMRPEWREWARNPPVTLSAKDDAKIFADIEEFTKAPRVGVKEMGPYHEPERMIVQRSVPLYRGKWRMLPPEIENSPKE